MYSCSCVDALVFALLMAAFAFVGLAAFPRVDVVASILSGIEGAIWSSARWATDYQTKTEGAVRVGIVGWPMFSWVIRPAFGFVKRWARTRQE